MPRKFKLHHSKHREEQKRKGKSKGLNVSIQLSKIDSSRITSIEQLWSQLDTHPPTPDWVEHIEERKQNCVVFSHIRKSGSSEGIMTIHINNKLDWTLKYNGSLVNPNCHALRIAPLHINSLINLSQIFVTIKQKTRICPGNLILDDDESELYKIKILKQ